MDINFKDSLGYNVMIPISLITTYNFISFEVTNVHVEVFSCVTIFILFKTDTGGSFSKSIKLCDTDYSSWGTDDNYIINYIKDNIQTIYYS